MESKKTRVWFGKVQSRQGIHDMQTLAPQSMG